jgi:nucleoside-diphosphate-sugar epimerase
MITGSEGLVGRALVAALDAQGVPVRRFNLQAPGTDQGDIRDVTLR